MDQLVNLRELSGFEFFWFWFIKMEVGAIIMLLLVPVWVLLTPIRGKWWQLSRLVFVSLNGLILFRSVDAFLASIAVGLGQIMTGLFIISAIITILKFQVSRAIGSNS